MKQKLITPDCPRCHGALWAVPCPKDGTDCNHFECAACGVEWVHRAIVGPEWYRFDERGQVLEVFPPRSPVISVLAIRLRPARNRSARAKR